MKLSYQFTICKIVLFISDVVGCEGIPCQNGGSCSDGIAGFTCKCAAGYEGARCETGIYTKRFESF